MTHHVLGRPASVLAYTPIDRVYEYPGGEEACRVQSRVRFNANMIYLTMCSL